MSESQPPTQPWQILVAERRRELDALISSQWRLSEEFRASLPADSQRVLCDSELGIMENYSAGQLFQRLAWGDSRSVDGTTAFCKRVAITQQLDSCITEHFFSKALERARYLDEYLKREGKGIGPVHGLPISIRYFLCRGCAHDHRYVSFLNNGVESQDSTLVSLLLDLGAALYVKTNIPQTLMSADPDNNIYGRTLNPHNTNLTAGGSGGGEGALVALRGSILGIGNDIGDFTRIPALCCGVYGFKSTSNRIIFVGQVLGMMPGVMGIESSAGTLAQTFDDLRYHCPVAWSRVRVSIFLTFGVLPEDPKYPLHSPVRRALESAIAVLQGKRHRIVRLPSDPSRDIAYASRWILHGEPPVQSVANFASPMFPGTFPVSQELEVFEKLSALYIACEKIQRLDAYPACIIPYLQASKNLDSEPMLVEDDDPEAVHGAPWALQIVTPRFQDEKCLAVARVIDRDIRLEGR
ncbi:hypothetical protein BDV12DRAFT_208942 [Aspergillus spectabilis]